MYYLHENINMKNKPLLSIVMPTYWHLDYTKEALSNLKDVLPSDTEIIVIDDGSTDWTVEYLKQQKGIKFIDNKINKWVTYSWNLWVELAQWNYICVINNDVVFPNLFFERLINGFNDDSRVIFTVPRRTNGRKWKENMVIRYYWNHLCWFCFMIKQEDKNIIFPLEPRLRIFGSDNRAYHKAKEMWFKINTIKDAVCHHYESITSKSEYNIDTEIFYDIAKEEWWNIVETIYVDKEPIWNVLI